MKLNQLKTNPGATKARTRVGRGIGSTKGGTAGRGTKGQKSRSGVSLVGFEGGQMPIHRRLPKRGFKNIFGKSYALANLGRIQKAIDDKKLNASKTVNREALIAAGVINSSRGEVKLLGKGEIKAKLNIEVAWASQGAVKAVEKAGGKVTLLEVREEKPKKEKKAKKAKKPEDLDEETEAKKPEEKSAEKAEAKDAEKSEDGKKE